MSIAWKAATAEMADIFSVRNEVQSWLDFEAALARAEAEHGLIPQDAAAAITAKADVDLLDLAALDADIAAAVHPIMPFVRHFTAACDEASGQYIHWGTTTQDVLDTGWVLRTKQAEAVIRRDLERLTDLLRAIAREHRDTPMAGRTHSQHAIPITFGYKVAVWVDELERIGRHLDLLRDELFALQFGGATGTLASIGPLGLAVRRSMAADLGLSEPTITWHVPRDRFAQLAFQLALIASSLQRAAFELVTLQRTEVGELEEPFHHGKVGSSTMPHKRNPAISESMWTFGELVKNDVRSALSSLGSLHERDKAVYTVEVDYLPRVFGHTHRMLEIALRVFGDLTVDVERMRANLDLSGGMLFSEQVLMRLAERLGRQRAHDVLYDLTMAAFDTGTHLRQALLGDPTITEHFSETEIDAMFDPGPMTETAGLLVDAVCTPTADRPSS
jgi:3-carboxy-cis,cis-muconate cycloisomerase